MKIRKGEPILYRLNRKPHGISATATIIIIYDEYPVSP